MKILKLENSDFQSVRNCPNEIWLKITSFLKPSEVKKMAKFLPIMEESYNIAKKMNRFGYLKEDDEKEEEKNQQGFYNQHFA